MSAWRRVFQTFLVRGLDGDPEDDHDEDENPYSGYILVPSMVSEVNKMERENNDIFGLHILRGGRPVEPQHIIF